MRLIDADEILKILKEHAKSFIPNYEEDNYEAGVLEGLALAECEVNVCRGLMNMPTWKGYRQKCTLNTAGHSGAIGAETK